MPTRRENLLTMLTGGKPAWRPCTLNFGQWYRHHRENDKLPEELRGTQDLVDAQKRLGLDIFSRNLDGGFRQRYEGVEIETVTEDGSEGPRTTFIFKTPHGDLRRVHEEQTRLTTGYEVEDLVKDWDRDGDAFLWVLERLRPSWDRQVFLDIDARLGDDGLVLLPVGHTPMKHLHMNFGLDNACFFMLDHPDAAARVCEMYWQRLWPVLEEMAAEPRVSDVILMDNVDTPFYPPQWAELYWTPYVRQAVELFEPRGKRVWVHACGQLAGLADQFNAAGVHGLEGMAHPPLGDFGRAELDRMHPRFIYNGGFTAHEQVTRSDEQTRAFYERFFAEMKGFDRWMFAAACQTSIDTAWERIKLAVSLCREFGGSPAA